MKPCTKCGKNNWSYVKLDNNPNIYCTCKNCGYEVSFEVKKRCGKCKQGIDAFIYEDIDDNYRNKICPKCGAIKSFLVAKAIFHRGVLQNPKGVFIKGYKEIK